MIPRHIVIEVKYFNLVYIIIGIAERPRKGITYSVFLSLII